MPSARRLAPLLTLLLAGLAGLVALAPAADAAGLRATRRALAREMASAGAAGAYVADLDTGRRLFAWQAGVPRIPASVNKLFTTATALTRFGTDGRLRTDVLAQAAPSALGVVGGDVYLRGGGDPAFGTVQGRKLAQAIAGTGLRRVTGRVVGDESAWDTLRGGPSSSFRTDYWVGPLSALSFDHGLTGSRTAPFQSDPARFAARAFTRALRRAGVSVGRSAAAGVAPATAVPVLSWLSPEMATLVARTNTPSDNYMAEELLKAIGARFGLAGSTGAGATVVRATVARLGARPSYVDGSGLSRRDATTPRDVVDLIRAMDASDAGAAFEASLPVMGRTGTLVKRLRTSVARDRCHAKTGTLSDVSALAGVCETTYGRRVAFAFLMNRTSVYWAHVRQDRMTAALATLR
jgi:D-alanyl-D-alanine carboxypeptidase/D-alanyl-D-alanine-endopeptidase (penicillin-binding protein 4)